MWQIFRRISMVRSLLRLCLVAIFIVACQDQAPQFPTPSIEQLEHSGFLEVTGCWQEVCLGDPKAQVMEKLANYDLSDELTEGRNSVAWNGGSIRFSLQNDQEVVAISLLLEFAFTVADAREQFGDPDFINIDIARPGQVPLVFLYWTEDNFVISAQVFTLIDDFSHVFEASPVVPDSQLLTVAYVNKMFLEDQHGLYEWNGYVPLSPDYEVDN